MNIVMVLMAEGNNIIRQSRTTKLMVNNVMPFHMISRTAYLADISVSFPSCPLCSCMCR